MTSSRAARGDEPSLYRFADMYQSSEFAKTLFDEVAQISDVWYVITGSLLAIVAVFSIICNTLTLCFYPRIYSTRRKRVINLPVISLTISNLGINLSNFPFMIWSSAYRGWQFSATVCRIAGCLGGTFAFMQIGTLALLVHQRYRATTSMMPIKVRTRYQVLTIGGVWLASFSLAVLPLFGVSSFVLDGLMVSCTFNYLETTLFNLIYIGCIILLGFIVPLALISFWFGRIFRLSRLSGLQMRGPAVIRSKFRQRQFRLAATAARNIACFCFSWTPYCIITIIAACGQHINPVVANVAVITAKCSTALTAILYVTSLPEFSRLFKVAVPLEKPSTMRSFATTKRSSETERHYCSTAL